MSRDDPFGGGGGKTVIRPNPGGGGGQAGGGFPNPGGGAGFLMVEADTPRDISEILEPYMDLMSWDVHAVTSNTYKEKVAELKKQLKDM